MSDRAPLRTCVACRRARPKEELLRLARARGGEVRVDPAGTAPGRGAYVCREGGCAERAVGRGAIGRSLGAGPEPDEVARLRAMAGGTE